jgi:hypothetical protein
MNLTDVPVIVTEEAATQVASLGMQREMEQMIDWTQKNVPNLRAIRVKPSSAPFPHGVVLVIKAHCEWSDNLADAVPVEWDWACWKVQVFPPAVCARFIMSCTFQPLPQ